MPVSAPLATMWRHYVLVLRDGSTVEIEADSAAQAVALAAPTQDILRITNLGVLSKRMMERHVLTPSGQDVHTDITLADTKPLHVEMDAEEAQQQAGEDFTPMNLVEYSHASLNKPAAHGLFVTLDLGALAQPAEPAPVAQLPAMPVAEPEPEVAADQPEAAEASDASVDDLAKGMSEAELALMAEYLEKAAAENIVEIDAPMMPASEHEEAPLPEEAAPTSAPPPPAAPEEGRELSPEEVRQLLSMG
jgi:hypothetical protein